MKWRKCFPFAVAMMKMISTDYNQTSKDNKHRRTSPATWPGDQELELDQRADNESHSKTTAVENAGKKEMKSAALSWEQMDIFLSHGDANDEDDCL